MSVIEKRPTYKSQVFLTLSNFRLYFLESQGCVKENYEFTFKVLKLS